MKFGTNNWKLVLGVAVLAAMSVAAAVQDRTVVGVVVDNNTLPGILRADDPEDAALGLEKTVVISEEAQKAGYTILSGKRQTKLDKASVTLVAEFLKKDDSTLYIRVTGTDSPSGFVVKTVARAQPKP